MNLNLIMAVVWLVVGVVWLATTWVRGDVLPVIRLGDVQFSPAWLAFLLCLYNIARWRLSPRRRQPTLEEALDARRRMHRTEERPPTPPDPTFNFTDAPPPPPDAPRPDV